MKTLAPYVLVRAAEFPIDSLGRADACVAEAIGRVERLDAELDAMRGELCGQLHAAVPAAPRELRRRLLAVKRSVYAGRAASDQVIDGASGLAGRVRAWNSLVRRRDDDWAAAERALASDTASRLEQLELTWRSEHFRSALLFASPDLYAQFYNGGPRRERRRVTESALAYHVRAATKTSPFSRFTALGLVGVGDSHSGWESPDPLTVRPVAELNAVLAERLDAGLARAPDLRGGHRVALNPTVTRDNGSLVALHRPREPGRIQIARADERFLRVEVSPALELVLALVSTRDLTLDELVRATAERLGDKTTPEAVRDFADRLVRIGVLELHTGIPTAEPDALARYAASENGEGPRSRLAAACREILTELTAIPHATPEVQALATDRIRSAADDAASVVGDENPYRSVQGLVFLSDVVTDRLTLESKRLEPVASALCELTRAMMAFDAGLVMRRVATRFFLGTAGAGGRMPLTAFIGGLYENCYQPLFGERTETPFWEPFDPLIPSGVAPEVEAMAALRGEFVDACTSILDTAEGDAVELPIELLHGPARAAVANWPAPIDPSVGVFAQLCATAPDEPYRLVVNHAVPGYASYVARYCDERVYGSLGRDLRGSVRERLRAAVRGAELAEIVAPLGFNGQMHQALTRRRIPYPGAVFIDDDSHEMRWEALEAAYWPEADIVTVVDTRDGARYLPFCPGPLAPHLMPLSCRLLTALGPALTPDFSLLDLVEHRRGAAAGEIRFYPELRLGPLTLLRRTWRVPAASLPPRGTTELHDFRIRRRWAARHGLARRVFVTPMRLPDVLRSGRTPERLRRLYKPFFVDFDDPLSSRLLRRYCGRIDASLTFAEAVPDVDRSALRRGGSAHAAELFLECWPGVRA